MALAMGSKSGWISVTQQNGPKYNAAIAPKRKGKGTSTARWRFGKVIFLSR
jgi:hypothetical protein